MATATRPESAAVTMAPSPVYLALTEHRGSIEDLLPEGVTLNRVIALVKNEAIKNPQLLLATPVSLVTECARIYQWGLEIGITAYLVPFKDKKSGDFRATAIAGYKGLAELMVASRAVRAVQARAVFENDEFAYELGLADKLRHVPEPIPAKRGALKGAYCILRLAGGADVFEYLSVEEIDETRKQFSQKWRDGPCPPWYAKKTVIRRASDLVPKNPRLSKYFQVLREDEALERAEPTEAEVLASTPSEPNAGALTGSVQTPAAATASEEQITRILDLIDHVVFEDDMREKVKTALANGMKAERAEVVIAGLEKTIAAVTPKPITAAVNDGLPF